MYSRADKSVGYATPAYMADHACNSTELRFDMSVNLDVDKLNFLEIWLCKGERGRCYLEAVYGASDIQSTLGSSSSEVPAPSELMLMSSGYTCEIIGRFLRFLSVFCFPHFFSLSCPFLFSYDGTCKSI